jgi:sugar lactone lactonase YvrE
MVVAGLAVCSPQAHAKEEKPKPAARELDVIKALPYAPGNVAVSEEGRLFFSLHQFFNPDYRVLELEKTVPKPFPSSSWNKTKKHPYFDAVLGLNADDEGNLWMLDNGLRLDSTAKLVAWDLKKDALKRIYYLPDHALVEGSMPNDLAIDPKRERVYIADSAAGNKAAFIVIDIRTGQVWRVLQGHESVIAKEVDIIIDETIISRDGSPVRVGLNPITIDPEYQWVYYGAMNGNTVWRIPAEALADKTISNKKLANKIERYGRKPVSDGITIDAAGNVYITDLQHHAIGVTRPDGSYEILIQDEQILQWPDSLANGPKGYIYGVANKLHESSVFNEGKTKARPPYYLFRFEALGATEAGR